MHYAMKDASEEYMGVKIGQNVRTHPIIGLPCLGCCVGTSGGGGMHVLE